MMLASGRYARSDTVELEAAPIVWYEGGAPAGSAGTGQGEMNLHQLRIFYTVAQRMSFTAAAGNLFMTQPAVSLQVRALERLCPMGDA